MSYSWPVGCIKRVENDINIAKQCIHKAAGSGINEMIEVFPRTRGTTHVKSRSSKYFQASVGVTKCLLLMNQGFKNSVHGVLQIYQFITVYAKKFCASYESMYAFFSIAYCCLSTECPWLSFFFTTNHNNCLVLWNGFHFRDRKIPYANLHQIMCYRYFT